MNSQPTPNPADSRPCPFCNDEDAIAIHHTEERSFKRHGYTLTIAYHYYKCDYDEDCPEIVSTEQIKANQKALKEAEELYLNQNGLLT